MLIKLKGLKIQTKWEGDVLHIKTATWSPSDIRLEYDYLETRLRLNPSIENYFIRYPNPLFIKDDQIIPLLEAIK